MCGVIAIYSQNNSARILYQGLMQLQHRGQDAAGIVTLKEDLLVKKGLGRVEEVFTEVSLSTLQGALGIGHTRYATSGGTSVHDVQPFYNNGIALAHSGHLHPAPWMDSVKKQKLHSLVDSNLLVHLLSGLLEESLIAADDRAFFSSLCQAVQFIYQHVKGSYSVVSLITGKGLLVFRDPQGIRPLEMGERLNDLGTKEYVFASESHFFGELGFTQTENVQPGEVIYINSKGQLYRHLIMNELKSPCSFEYIYFARPKSILNGISVAATRQKMGELLALRWQQLYPQLTPDFVMPIPKTANSAAKAFAYHRGFAYQEYLQINEHAGRTFIAHNSSQRQQALSNKLVIDADKVKNRKILLFDDSMVRGTTAIFVIKKLRLLGAKAIYLVLTCPPIINICTYGINIPTHKELIASGHSLEQLKSLVHVDKLLYLSTEELINAVGQHPSDKLMLCMRCMQTPKCTQSRDTSNSILEF